jgi:hypothetical protein
MLVFEIWLSTDKNDVECKVVHLVEARVGAHKLLEFIIGEGSKSFSCVELLQVEHIWDKLSRMCVAHIIATRTFDQELCVAWLIVTIYMLYM